MMNRYECQETLSNDSKEQNSKYEPILKFSYTNPHKIIKPVSNKPVTRWSPGENKSYVEKDLAESKYATPNVPESSPRYENISDLIDDDSTYESIEYVDGVYKMKAAEPLVISTRMPHRAVTRNTLTHSGLNGQIMFSEMTYEERQEERRRLELGEEKGFPVNDYFARSEALQKNPLSPTETHTRNNYSKWLLNELNKERNLSKLGEVRQKASVASAFREPRSRTATPTPPAAAAAHHPPLKTSHHVERAQREHISTARNCATEEHNTNGGSFAIKENENGESTSGSDSRSDSPFEFNSRRARFENPDSLKSDEIRSCGTTTEQSMESESFYANTVQEEGSSGIRRKWDTSSPLRQVRGISSPQERQESTSSYVQESTGNRYASKDHYEVTREYHINERQGYIEKISENGDENIYDYPQMPPKPVEVRFSFQPETASKFLKTSDTSSLKTSPQNNRTLTKDIQFTDMHGDHRFRTDMKRSNTPDSQRPYVSRSKVTDYSSAGKEEHSFASSQRALSHSQSRTHETSKNKMNFTSQDRSDTPSQKWGTPGGQRAMSYDLQSARGDKIKSSHTSTASQNAPVDDDKPTNVPAKFSATNPDAFYSTSSTELSFRKSRKDLFQETHQEREEKLELEKINLSSVRQDHGLETNSGKIKKYERKVSDMVKLFEELAQQQFLDEQNQKYGYYRIKSGSLNDLRSSNAMLNTCLYEKDLSTSASRSASCTQLYRSQAVEYNRFGPKCDSDATVGSLASQNKVLGTNNAAESTILQGTYKSFDDQKMSSYAPLARKAEQAVKKVDAARPWTPERYISKELTSESGNSVKQRSSRVAKTVVFNDDPPFFSTKTYSNTQTQQHSHSAHEKRKSDKVKEFDSKESTSSNFKNASSLHHSHDPQVSAFEKYESWRTNLKANERGLNENRFSHDKNRSTFSQQPSTHKTLDYVSSNERHTSDFSTDKRDASASRNQPGACGENYYVSSTVTMTRRLPQRSPMELNEDLKICSTLTDKCVTSSEKGNFRTTTSISNLANAHSNISTAPQFPKRTQQSPCSPAPTSQTVTRLHSPVRESIFQQGMSRSSSKLVSETERQFGSSNQMGLSEGQDPSYRSSKALSNQRFRPRSQSADPEQSMRKASGAFGLEAFRVMSPGPAPHFVRMTEEARRKAEDYHVNSEQKLLNIFFDRLIEQHKYSSTSNLQAKRAIVEQSRFIKDSPKFLKQSSPNDNYSQSRQLTSRNIQEAERKQPETLQSSSLQRASNSGTTLEHSERSFNTVVGSSGLTMSPAEKILSGQVSNFEGTTESHTQNRTTNSSRFQPGITYSDEKNAFHSGDSANYQKLAHQVTGQPGMTESSDEAKVVGRFQVQKRNTRSSESAGGPSPTPGFVNQEFSRHCQDMTNKSLRNIEKKMSPEVSSCSTSQFSVSNRDFSSGSSASAARIYSDNARKMPPQPTAEPNCPPDPDYYQVTSREYSSHEKVFSRDAIERKSRGNLSYPQCSSNAQTERKVPKEYFHSQELSSFLPRSSRQGHDRLLSPVAYSKTSRSEMAYSSPLNLPSRALSPASSLFTDDRNWSPRVQSPSQFNSVVNIQTLERSAPSPVAHNDSQKDSNVLRFMVNSYDDASDIEARKQMYFRSLDADCTPLTSRVQSPLQSSVARTERA